MTQDQAEFENEEVNTESNESNDSEGQEAEQGQESNQSEDQNDGDRGDSEEKEEKEDGENKAEWDENDPDAVWARNRIKKYKRTTSKLSNVINEKDQEIEKLKKRIESTNTQGNNGDNAQPPAGGYYPPLFHPNSGEPLSPGTPEYGAMYNAMFGGDQPTQQNSQSATQPKSKSTSSRDYALEENIKEQATEAAGKFKDLVDVLDDHTNAFMVKTAAEIDDELGVEGLYQLAKANPQELRRIKKLPAIRQVVEMDKWLSKYRQKRIVKKNIKSSAPPPTGNSPTKSTATSKSVEKMSLDEMKQYELDKRKNRSRNTNRRY